MKKNIGCLGYLLLAGFLFFLVLNINYYRSDNFKIPAFGKSHRGMITSIDSSQANYQNYTFTYNIKLEDNAAKIIQIKKITRRSIQHISERVIVKSLDGKYDFTFSVESVLFMVVFGFILILSGFFLIRFIKN